MTAALKTGPELRSENTVLFAAADVAYAADDWDWFETLSEPELLTLWASVSGENMSCGKGGGAWDDEVYEALASKGYWASEESR